MTKRHNELTVRSVGQLLAKSGGRFDQVFQDNFVAIQSAIVAAPGIKGDLRLREKDDEYAKELVRFCALVNDLTTAAFIGGSNLSIAGFTPEGLARTFGKSQVAIRGTEKSLKALEAEAGDSQIMPVFVDRTDDWAKGFARDISPLIETGRVLLKPNRALMSLRKTFEDGHREFHVHEVDNLGPFDVWDIVSDSAERPIPVCAGQSEANDETTLFSVTIPFISGASFTDLAKILEDEEHHIAKLRVGLHETVGLAKAEGRQINSVVNDILRPKLDELDRRLKTASSSSAWRMAGVSISTVSLALVAAVTQGWPAAMAAIGGASGFGLLATEKANRIEKLAEVKEDPFYLLWRCREISRRD